MKIKRIQALIFILACVSLLFVSSVASAAVDKVRCVVWQGDPVKYHTAIDNKSVRLAGVVTTTDTSQIWYKWVFGDGSESGVSSLSGKTIYNIAVDHTYTGAVGTPFTAQLMVDSVDSSMANAVADIYLVKIEENTLDAEVNIAIDKGLWWLYTQKEAVGSSQYRWNNSRYGNHYANTTGSAVQAYEINGHKETGDPNEDPYVEIVRGGIDYLMTILIRYNIGLQSGGDPDSNHNGIGLSVNSNRPIYELGAVMDALVASGDPNAIARTGSADVIGRRYQDIVQDMVDMYAWGQSDSGSYRGGWRYSWNADADNSAAQWGAIGMIAAERHFGCIVPQWVKDLNNSWLNNSYNSAGYFGYTNPNPNRAFSTGPCGMVQLSFAGKDTTDSRWIACEQYIATRWSSFLSLSRDCRYYSYYAFAKAMRLAMPNEVTHFASTGLDWYGNETQGMARHLVNIQNSNGSWAYDGWPYVGERTAAAWMIITLKPALFAAAPISCFTANPNPTYPDGTIVFDPSCSDHSETGKDITNLTLFEWDWDNDGTYDHSTATPLQVTHAFSCVTLPCTYPVTLRVTDDSTPALTATYTLDILISNPPHPPVAEAGGPYVVSLCQGDILTLDGTGSFEPNEGEHEAGCGTCPDDTITAWDWDLVPPLTDFNNESGESVVLDSTDIASYFTAGSHNIALQVTDNTAAAFPNSGDPDLTDADFATVDVYEACNCDITAAIGCNSIVLTWSTDGSYEAYRSTSGPNQGFVKIGDASGTSYEDTNVVSLTMYWYRIKGINPVCMSSAIDIVYVFDPANCPCVDDLAARPKRTKVQLTWTHTGADHYNIYRGTTSGGPYTFIASTTSTYSTYLDSDVTLGNTYYYVVREATANDDEICQSNEASVTLSARTR